MTPAVLLRGLALEPAALLEAAHDPAQISGVDAKLAAQVGGRCFRAVRKLVEHARLRQRQRAVQQAFLENADLARVEPVEPADALDAFVESSGLRLPRHGRQCGTNQLTLSTGCLPDCLPRYRRGTAGGGGGP